VARYWLCPFNDEQVKMQLAFISGRLDFLQRRRDFDNFESLADLTKTRNILDCDQSNISTRILLDHILTKPLSVS